MPLKFSGQEMFDQLLNLRLPEMQQMSGVIKGKPVFLIRPTESADLLLALIEPIGDPGKMIRGTESGQAGADDDDHAALCCSMDSSCEPALPVRDTSILPKNTVAASKHPMVPRHKAHAPFSPTAMRSNPIPATTAVAT